MSPLSTPSFVRHNSVIERIVPLQPRLLWARVTVWPFLLAYLALLVTVCDPSVLWSDAIYMEYQRQLDFVHTLAIPLCGLLHLVVFLLTYWVTPFQAWVRYTPPTVTGSASPSRCVASASHALVLTKPHKGEPAIVPLQRHRHTGDIFLLFQLRKWTFDTNTQQFRKPQVPVSLPCQCYLDAVIDGGLTPQTIESSRAQYGPNRIHMPLREFPELLLEHLRAPFFVFQMVCVILWCLDEYWMLSLFNGGMVLMMECTVVAQRLRNMSTMHDMAAVPVTEIEVRRRENARLGVNAMGRVEATVPVTQTHMHIPSTELLPLDVVFLTAGIPAPADLVLIQGTAVVNEAMLTGESTPQMKTALSTCLDSEVGDSANDKATSAAPSLGVCLSTKRHTRHMLYAGTQILSVSCPFSSSSCNSNDGAVSEYASRTIAVVLRTGFETKQGKLVRTIVSADQRVSQNSGEALGFIALLLVFACVAAWYVLQRGLANPTKDRWKMFLTCAEIMTNVVPPELPMELTLAVNFSLMALMKLKVFCTEPFRIPFAGKLDTCCFDKTGTLTTDEMLFVGVDLCDGNSLVRVSGGSSCVPREAELVLATCHSLVKLRGSPSHGQTHHQNLQNSTNAPARAVGDAMEKAAFDSLGWTLGTNTDSLTSGGSGDMDIVMTPQPHHKKPHSNKTTSLATSRAIHIVKRFLFDPSLRRMSCIICEPTIGTRSHHHQYATLRTTSQQHDSDYPHTTHNGVFTVVCKGSPEDVGQLLTSGSLPSRHGSIYRSYAVRGYRVIALAKKVLDHRMEWNHLSRREAESQLSFAGLAIFECPLKKDAPALITSLQRGLHRCVMITGDSVQTAMAVARDVGMLTSPHIGIACGALSSSVCDGGDVCSGEQKLENATKGATVQWEVTETGAFFMGADHPAVDSNTSDPYRVVPELPPKTDACVSMDGLSEAQQSHLVSLCSSRVTVWARCAPQQKEAIVMALRVSGAVVLMAGDGTNDVAGLKKAHVGVAVLNAALLLGSDNLSEGTRTAAATSTSSDGDKGTNASTCPPDEAPPVPPSDTNTDFKAHFWYQWALAKHKAASMRQKRLMVAKDAQSKVLQQRQEKLKKAQDAANVSSASAFAAMSSIFNEVDDTGGTGLVKLGDASVAAPFTCKAKTLMSVVDIVRLGRSTLVNTMQMYRILALNCLLSAYVMAVLFSDGVKFGQSQMIFAGGVVSICFLLLTRSQPLPQLASQRPIGRVFHPHMMVTIFGQFVIHLSVLLRGVALVQSVETLDDAAAMTAQHGEDDAELADFRPTLLNTLVFLLSTLMTAVIFAVNYQGHPFKTSLRQNKSLLGALLVLGGFTFYCASETDVEFNRQFEMAPFPSEAFRHSVMELMVFDVIGCVVIDRVSYWVLGQRK